ncbi:MAG TPA: hypothetical protein VFA77_05905 [Candidatus Eisenbacteria bacterium]|nr:hypothetical protein [Candidatus Eisenbacteria bacterium]
MTKMISDSMIAGATSAAPDRRFSLPMDLTPWVGKETLLAWTIEEVEQLNWANPELVAYLRANPAFRPKMLLCLLTYSYASGNFASEDIAQSCDAAAIQGALSGAVPRTIDYLVKITEAQTVVRSLCGDDPPSANAIRRFRRENRGLLKWCLAQVFRRALEKRFDLSETIFPAGLKRYSVHAAEVRLDIARQMDRAEEP